jgi:hypothetical protein
MKSKIAKGEINPRPLFRKSLFSSFLYYFVLIYVMSAPKLVQYSCDFYGNLPAIQERLHQSEVRFIEE